jgi:hypothetical protein
VNLVLEKDFKYRGIMYRPQFASGTSLAMGTAAQNRFDKIAKAAHIWFRVATLDEERHHIDRVIEYKGKMIPVEIKSMKKISRADPAPQDRYTWIELHGVHPSDRGWLYGGKAELIAFETRYGFLFVYRTDLANLVNKTVNFNARATSPQDAINKVYERRAQTTGNFGGGNDQVTLIDSKKIENISFMSWRI